MGLRVKEERVFNIYLISSKPEVGMKGTVSPNMYCVSLVVIICNHLSQSTMLHEFIKVVHELNFLFNTLFFKILTYLEVNSTYTSIVLFNYSWYDLLSNVKLCKCNKDNVLQAIQCLVLRSHP